MLLAAIWLMIFLISVAGKYNNTCLFCLGAEGFCDNSRLDNYSVYDYIQKFGIYYITSNYI